MARYKVYIRRADVGTMIDILIVVASSKSAAENKGKKVVKALHSGGDYQIFAERLGRRKR